ncbi:MAG: rRNA maturation RNase YbeY [Pseudomonadota bacterium]|nr:rRNA maturation RNase YbeY [Pseudomonadota bacterium]
MRLSLINKTKSKMNLNFIRRWVKRVEKEIPKIKKFELTIAIVGSDMITRLNKTYRKKNKVTDILSFESTLPDHLGELAICLQKVRSQAKLNKHSVQVELNYLILHGILHLLGYNHEKGGHEAKKMFKIQDGIFNRLYPS